MQRTAKQDQEMVRRLLKAALNNLDGELPGNKESSDSILLSDNHAGAPVILLLVGGLNAQVEDASPAPVGAATGGHGIEKSSASSLDQTQGAPAVHPGLERFPLAATDALPAVPKACFMEPGRTCVSSGACEMRGF